MNPYHLGNARAEADGLVIRYHYSHRPPANVQFVQTAHESGGLFGDYGPAVAAVFFSLPPTRWDFEVWELSRLVRRDNATIHLSWLIGQAVRHIKRKRGCPLLVSFADKTAGHHGGIYQACGWRYHGARAPANTGLVVNGTFVPGRTCNSVYGTRSADKLKDKHPQWDISPVIDAGKHLYWKSVNQWGKARAKALGLESLPYPAGEGSTENRCRTTA